MGSAAIEPSAAVGRLLRQKRLEQDLSLEAVSERLRALGHRIPGATLGRIERGEADPGVRRLYLLLDLYGVRPGQVADLVEMERLAGKAPAPVPQGDLETLHKDGVEAWKRGEISKGLAYLMAVRQHVPATDRARILRQKATLAFATFARALGKFELARNVVDEVLCEPPDPSLRVRALVIAASLWRGLGSFDAAMGLVQRAEKILVPGNKAERAWVLHQKARLLIEIGESQDAALALTQAIRAYREVGDTYGEMRALVLRIKVQEAIEGTDAAMRVARRVIRQSQQQGRERGVVYGHLELGRLLIKASRYEEAYGEVALALADAIRLGEKNAQFVAHYHQWKASVGMGDEARAAVELKAAAYFGSFVDEHTPELDEVKKAARHDSSRVA